MGNLAPSSGSGTLPTFTHSSQNKSPQQRFEPSPPKQQPQPQPSMTLKRGLASSFPTTPSSSPSAHQNRPSSSSNHTSSSSTSIRPGPMAMNPHSIPKPRKYMGHYDIADRTFQLLSRHRAAACILFWSLTILLDILLQLPIEWFFLFYFILALVFRIFFIGGHIVLISIGAMCVSNAIVFYTVPFSFTSPFATGVAFGLMVSLIHGLNLKGVILAMTMYMLKPYLERQTVIAALNPPTVPSIVFLAPLAAFCSAFGVLWLLYDLFGYLHASTDDLRDFFGITLPAPSIVTLKEVKDRSITLHWQCSSQATISKHLIEIDGLLIGESGKQETSVVIQGLYPDNTYRIRLWAITTRNWKTPSDYVVVRTLASVPVELELSSVENARRESELAKNLEKERETLLTAAQDSTIATTATPTDKDAVGATNDQKLLADLGKSNEELTGAAATQPMVRCESETAAPAKVVYEDQILALRTELEQKEASFSQLTQQLSDLEKTYKTQDELLRNEIAALREQQKQEEEPRQQAKAKLKELEESLREAEVNKSKVEKEHRIEVDKRQRLSDQLEAKRRRVEQLQQTLKQNGEKLIAEKESRRRHVQELEVTLKRRTEEVKAAEVSLQKLQASQKTLSDTIEAKERDLQKIQPNLHAPKGVAVWDQKNRELDLKCAQLTQQLDQCKAENQQLQERLADVSKSVNAARKANEDRRAEVNRAKLTPATRQAALDETTYKDHGVLDQGSNWMSAGWGKSPGTTILNGLFQDDGLSPGPKAMSRKTAGPPPGFPQRGHGAELLSDAGSFGLGRSAAGSFVAVDSGNIDTRESGGGESPLIKARSQDARSRTSSVSSLNGYQSPLFEPAFAFSNSSQGYQSSLPPRQAALRHQQPLQQQQQQQQHQAHIQSPGSRARFQDGLMHSPPISAAQAHWGVSNGASSRSVANVNGPIGRSPVLENLAPANSQSFDYHRFFSPVGPQDASSSGADHQLNEQSVIQSMFESPDTLGLRHHLRSVGSHPSLTARAKVLPSHLRTISTPGTSSPLSSPTTTSFPVFQQSPTWDFKSITRPASIGRITSQVESGSKLLNSSEISSPSSPRLSTVSPGSSAFSTRPLTRRDTLDRGLWGGYGNGSHGEVSHGYEAALDLVSDPWQSEAKAASQNRLQNIGTAAVRESSSGGAGMEGMLSSPTGSSVSSLDTGTPRSVEAQNLVFADHYFSHRNHRGFDAPSTLTGGNSFSTPSAKPLGTEGPVGLMMGQGSKRSELRSNVNGVSDSGQPSSLETGVFGYGLKLNPFGWSLPTDLEDEPTGQDASS
ncbi:hypothetical protein EMPS_05632 [Entomortierella parvispora]|uniref:Fibronectin type-III domain-containing protein n=1 Tax=Entomortierella parvispora TaxID=205924 RepID=A0A9P3HAP7_9FUNG|nr:hypothetical protein EMPS_05632 [Entomortierella parvispora]